MRFFAHTLAALWQGQKRKRVLGEYAAIGNQFQFFLADVAGRNFVYSEKPPAKDLYEAGKFEGRRELALEICKACNTPFADLEALIDGIERKPKTENK